MDFWKYKVGMLLLFVYLSAALDTCTCYCTVYAALTDYNQGKCLYF